MSKRRIGSLIINDERKRVVNSTPDELLNNEILLKGNNTIQLYERKNGKLELLTQSDCPQSNDAEKKYLELKDEMLSRLKNPQSYKNSVYATFNSTNSGAHQINTPSTIEYNETFVNVDYQFTIDDTLDKNSGFLIIIRNPQNIPMYPYNINTGIDITIRIGSDTLHNPVLYSAGQIHLTDLIQDKVPDSYSNLSISLQVSNLVWAPVYETDLVLAIPIKYTFSFTFQP